eukprot:6175197-Pleurochrysis_carterae.AAC.1
MSAVSPVRANSTSLRAKLTAVSYKRHRCFAPKTCRCFTQNSPLRRAKLAAVSRQTHRCFTPNSPLFRAKLTAVSH